MILLILLFFVDEPQTEPQWTKWLIENQVEGVSEHTLWDKSRVDILTETYAIEVDWSKKWAEAVGQAIYYSKMTGKKPAIILLTKEEEDVRYHYRAKIACGDSVYLRIFDINKRRFLE